MDHRFRVAAALCTAVALFLAVMLGALALVEPFDAAEYQAVDDPDDPSYGLAFFLAILVATGFMLAAIKYGATWLVRGTIVFASGLLAWFVLAAIVPPLVTLAGIDLLALLGALFVAAGLLAYPEWYVIDVAGVLMGAGAAALLGISLGLFPVLVFLVVLAVYDAISVYKTGHMITLAEGVMDMHVPVVLVVPTSLSYSFRDLSTTDAEERDDSTDQSSRSDDSMAPQPSSGQPEDIDPTASPGDFETVDESLASGPRPAERDALFIGLGDAVMPAILVASAAWFLDAPTIAVPLLTLNTAALGAVIGTVVGLLALLALVLRGRAHAGLPLLNGGAILGYLLAAVASGVSLSSALGL